MEYINLPDFSGGNNLLIDPKRIQDNQTLRTSNLVPYAKGVLEKKKGSATYLEIEEGTIVPNMTADDAPSPVVVSTDYVPATGDDAADIWKMFDGRWATNGSVDVGCFIKVNLGAGNTEKITGISMRAFATGWGIKTFTLSGSNNDSTWTAILTAQAVSDSAQLQTFSFNETAVAYRYFRITVTEAYPTNRAYIREIKLIQAPYQINEMIVVNKTTNKYMLAATNYKGAAVNDIIYQSKNGAAFVALTAATGVDTLTPGSDYTFAVDAVGSVYISNGVDNMQVSTTCEARADVAFTTGSLTPTGKYLLWWKDRLWVAGDSTDPHAVFYSDNLTPTTFNPSSVLYCGSKDPNDPIMGIKPLTLTTATEGIIDVLAVFRKNSIYVIGFDTAPTYIDQLSGTIGCWDSKSIVSTPLGIMFVGKDNVYSLGLTGEPSPIGSAIKPIWDGSHATRGRNLSVRTVCAKYFDGFVRFSYPEGTSTYNNREYWLDIRDYSNVGWFGDHIGLNINSYAVDGNTLYAGSGINGEVYTLEQSTRTNLGADIPIELQTKYYSLDNSEYTTKIMKRYSFNITPNNDDLVPTMTSNSLPAPYVVSAYSEAGAGWAAWKAFNGVTTSYDGTTTHAWQSGTDPTEGWIKVDFGNGITKIVRKLRIWNKTDYGFKDFIFQGSNDDTNWTNIYTGTAVNPATIADEAWEEFRFTNETAYRYYRIWCVEGHDTSLTSLIVSEIELIAGTVVDVSYTINDGEITGTNSFSITAILSALWNFFRGFFTHSDRGKFIGYTLSETSPNNIKIQNGLMNYIPTKRIL